MSAITALLFTQISKQGDVSELLCAAKFFFAVSSLFCRDGFNLVHHIHLETSRARWFIPELWTEWRTWREKTKKTNMESIVEQRTSSTWLLLIEIMSFGEGGTFNLRETFPGGSLMCGTTCHFTKYSTSSQTILICQRGCKVRGSPQNREAFPTLLYTPPLPERTWGLCSFTKSEQQTGGWILRVVSSLSLSHPLRAAWLKSCIKKTTIMIFRREFFHFNVSAAVGANQPASERRRPRREKQNFCFAREHRFRLIKR